MAKFVPDVNTMRWVVITPGRSSRPDDALKKNEPINKEKPICAFCEGSEHLTPPEVWRVGGEGYWNQPGWRIRVVPNKYTITDIHEVIIHSPDHNKDVEELNLEDVKLLFQVYRQRFEAHKDDGHVIIFCNHGSRAGASLGHPHSQLVVIPKQIALDALSREPIANIVKENEFFTVYCPDFSQWPYEVWIAPKEETNNGAGLKKSMFYEISNYQIESLAELLQSIIKRLHEIFLSARLKNIVKDSEFAYNYYLYHKEGWYLRIIPRFIHRAGFELGSGLSVNIIDPQESAKELKGL